MKRDGACESLWQQDIPGKLSADEIDNIIYDVLVVGAGITGISTALQLQKAGKHCIIAEAGNIAFGSTGGTTAHLNTILDTPYSEVIKNFGEDNAKLLLESAEQALIHIKHQINAYTINCEFKERESYSFSLDDRQSDILEDMIVTGQRLGIDIDYINDSPFPIPYLKIARAMGQGQFNPVKYVLALSAAFSNAGGKLVEDCRVTGIEEDSVITAVTSRGNIRALNIVYATHIPPGVNILHFRCAPYRSYAMAVKLKNGKYPEALGYDLGDPYHYYRSQVINGEEYLVAGGEDHKTGHEENTAKRFRDLESYLRQWFDIEKIAFKWSSQYFVPADGLPYIGRLPGAGNNIFVATGYNGNGMIFGTVAALLLSDLIVKGEHKYQALFDPQRVKPVAGFSNFIKEAADVVSEFVKGKFAAGKIKELAELAPGEARIIKYEDTRMALYKDKESILHAVDPACTHVHCTVGWNVAEQTWDCPCHGARYTCDGKVLNAPAQKNLEKIEFEKVSQ